MKRLICLVAAMLGSLAHATDLTVNVNDVKSAEGLVMAALYDSAGSFLKQPVQFGAAPAAQGKTTIVIRDVAPGDYALAVFHDSNGNGKLDKNPMGIPIEPYGFSNNALGTMAPPSFESAKLSVPADGAVADINLR